MDFESESMMRFDRTAGIRVSLAIIAACVGSIGVAAAEEPAIIQTSATAPANVSASGPVTLAYKLKPSQFVHYSGVNKIVYDIKLSEQYGTTEHRGVFKPLPLEHREFTSVQSNETDTHFRVISVDEAGIALIEPVIDRTHMTAKMHGKDPVEFDSSTNINPDPSFQAIRDGIGRTVARFQVGPTGKLLKAVIVDATAPQALRTAAEKLDTRFAYLSLLPSEPVSVGDKWREEYNVIVVQEGLKQPFTLRRIFELNSVVDGIATIKFKTLVMTKGTDEPEVAKQLMQQTPSGTIEFDIQQGLVRSYKSTINSTVINAFGRESMLRITGEATEKLVTAETAAK
jgi:hypothetical protein